MNVCTESFVRALETDGFHVEVDRNEEADVVTCNVSIENTSVKVRIFIHDDNTHAAIRCFGFAKVPEDRVAGALLACNRCNLEYRWVKFVLDDDHDLCAYDDAVVSPETAGEELKELLFRMLDIVDDCYPVFMKSIWA